MTEQERNFTSIQISKETRDRIKELALTQNESYENILTRLLDSKLGEREVEYILQDKAQECNVKAVVNWGASPENQCVKYYDKNGDCTEQVPVYKFEGDPSFQDKWDNFRETIEQLDNLISILGILEAGESIQAGDLILSRF